MDMPPLLDEPDTPFRANWLAVAGPRSKYSRPNAHPAGFLAGLWHGLICPITWIVSWFAPGVRVYERNNCGRWYEFGFMCAVLSLGGGGAVSHASSPAAI